MWKVRVLVALAVGVLPGLVLAPVWRLAGLGANEDDVLYYLPSRTFFHETVRAGQFPALNPWVGLGRPFLADPQSACWYPATWLFAPLPPLAAYPISLWLHYSLALWGMYRLARALELEPRAALLAGIAFAFCGFMLAHRAHFAMQHAAAWTPWVFWRLRAYTARGGGARLATAAAVIALQALAGHVQIAALTGLGALVFLLAQLPPAGRPFWPVQIVARFALANLGALGLAAIQVVPTVLYLQVTTRTERTYIDFVENSWHPLAALTTVLPMLLGQRTPNFFSSPWWAPSHQVEQFAYAGLAVLLLAVLAIRPGWRADATRRPWIILGLFAVLLALGQYGPLCPLLYWLPGSSLFRCPARALLLLNLALAVLAGTTLTDLATTPSPVRARLRAVLLTWLRRPPLFAGLLVAAPLALVLVALPLFPPEMRASALRALRPWTPAVWVPLLAALATAYTLALVARRWCAREYLWLVLLVTTLDLGVIGWSLDVPPDASAPQALLAPGPGSEWMDRVRASNHRLWVVDVRHGQTPGEYFSPVDKAVANTNVLHDIPVLTDYGPLQPRGIVAKFGFQPWGESWKAPELLADTHWMRLYNVGWILLCGAELPAPAGCTLELTTPAGWRLYRNPSAAGFAAFQHAHQVSAVQHFRHSPTHATTLCDTWPTGAAAPAQNAAEWPRLVCSALALPGWSAQSGNQALPIEVTDDNLLAVRVPPGEALTVDWRYRPPGLIPGIVLTCLSAIVLALAATRPAMPRRQRRSAARRR